ncbi:MAG: hypothetical protein ACYDA6_00680 [Solirubrobacteraceae bacterium]
MDQMPGRGAPTTNRPRPSLLARLRDRRQAARAIAHSMQSHTSVDAHSGAVRSVQIAELSLPQSAVEAVWSPEYLERLARTYWRFLARITLGLVHVHYGERERSLVLLAPPLRLITFAQPEYEAAADRGLVRWRIRSGLLVAPARRRHAVPPPPADDRHHRAQEDQGGHLQIEVRRAHLTPGEDAPAGHVRLLLTIEVANFHPAIAFAFSRRIYNLTQSRIHVLITRAFLRSLARGVRADGAPRLAVSRIGHLTDTRQQSPGVPPKPAPRDRNP